jgi:hypothetical protein
MRKSDYGKREGVLAITVRVDLNVRNASLNALVDGLS